MSLCTTSCKAWLRCPVLKQRCGADIPTRRWPSSQCLFLILLVCMAIYFQLPVYSSYCSNLAGNMPRVAPFSGGLSAAPAKDARLPLASLTKSRGYNARSQAMVYESHMTIKMCSQNTEVGQLRFTGEPWYIPVCHATMSIN